SRADRFWILNPDGAAAPGAALAFASADPGPFALMGGRVIYTHAPDTIQIDGGTVNRRTGVTGNVHLGASHAATPAPDPAAMDFITGASMVASRAFYDAAGPMPEDYFLYYEEVDWAFRRPAGLPYAYCPGGIVYHRAGTAIGSPTLDRVAGPFSQYFKHRGRMRFVRRHLPGAWLSALVYTGLKSAQYVVQGYGAEARAMLAGALDRPPPAAVRDRLAPAARALAFAPFNPRISAPAMTTPSQPAHKSRKGPLSRALRLVGSTLDPRAFAHAFRLLNYYNYSHVQPRRRLASVGAGAAISPNALFSNPERIEIGPKASIGARVHLWAGPSTGRIVIGAHTLVAPHVMITAANYRFNDGSPINDQAMDEADVIVGEDVWLGFGAVILPGARIGDGAVIGAGAVVRGEVAPGAVVAPATVQAVGQRIDRSKLGTAARGTGAPDPTVLALVRREFPALTEAEITAPIESTRLDSFDLITLRAALETGMGVRISDADWAGAGSLSELAALPVFAGAAPAPVATSSAARTTQAPAMPSPEPSATDPSAVSVRVGTDGTSLRRRPLDMPQMALSGLSESWLFKELGDIHWAMICAFLRQPSSAISDDTGARLYATFTRIRLDVDSTLRGFSENTPMEIASRLGRHGASFYFGEHTVTGGTGVDAARADARTMSTFAKYGERGNNTSLMKGTPVLPDPDAVAPYDAFPNFGIEYRERRAAEAGAHSFECDYEILPPHDINGVGLLYFAAYPTVVDLCLEKAEGKGFLMEHSTVAKDVLYFANCEPDETLVFRIHDRDVEPDGTIAHRTTISRKSDDVRMAEVLSRKRPSARPIPR
ncbi:hypothetical protein HKCCE3408_17230, partial [Rhodobacterales bacterium HKCCE3408]|nr:hypothetical protein [Rhodobacterales bacterium HKCCE3408]